MKETRKQIIEQTRNKVVAQYNAKIEQLEERIQRIAKEYEEEQKRRRMFQSKVEELEDQVNQYEDWNRRLQEYMDMTDADRKEYLENIKTKAEIDNKMKSMFGFYGKLMSNLYYL